MTEDKRPSPEEGEERARYDVERIEAGAVAIGPGSRAEQISNYYGEIIVRLDTIEDLPPAPGDPPYKGLSYFSEADTDIFFGREQVTAKLVERLQAARFLAVVGASGSGKSSLLRAGIVPALRRQNWAIHALAPGAAPLRNLATSLTRADLSADTTALQQRLAAEPGALPQVAGKLAARANQSRLLLLVDQFEETFTLCKDVDERQAFLNCLQAAAAEGGAATVLIGIRADFYDRCLQYEALRRVLAEQQEPLGPMTEEELVRVIAEPAKRGGWRFVEGLVEQMLEDVGREPGRLPLLSHALLETWERRRGTVMTLAGYREAGGVEGAIAHTAEQTLRNLPEEQVKVVQKLFLALTELGEGSEDTRRIVGAQELAQLGEREEVGNIIERLVRARLVTVDGDSVEVAHEALIRRWPRLREWLADNRERLRFERRLARDAEEWQSLGRDPGALYRGARLAQAVAWQDEAAGRLGKLPLAFLEASRALAEREEREAEAQRQRELAQQQALAAEQQKRAEEAEIAAVELRQRRNIAIAFAAGALALAIAAIFLAIWAIDNRAEAEANLELAQEAQATAEASQREAGLAATRAGREARIANAHRLVVQGQAIVEEHPLSALSLVLEGLRLVEDEPVAVQEDVLGNADAEVFSRGRIQKLGDDIGSLWGIVQPNPWLPEAYARLFVVQRAEGIQAYYDSSGNELTMLQGATIHWNGINPYGEQFVVGYEDGTNRVYHLGGSALGTVREGAIGSLTFGPGGDRFIVSYDDGEKQLYDASGTLVETLAAGTGFQATFDPAGDRFVARYGDGTNLLYDGGGTLLRELGTGQGNYARFGNSGAYFVLSLADGGYRFYDADGTPLEFPRQEQIVNVEFSRLGTVFVVADEDGTSELYKDPGTRVATQPGATIERVQFSRAGGLAIVVYENGSSELYDTEGTRLAALQEGEVFRITFGDDDGLFLIEYEGEPSRLYDGSGKLLREIDQSGFVFFSPKGNFLVISGSGSAETTAVYDASGTHVDIEQDEQIQNVTSSPRDDLMVLDYAGGGGAVYGREGSLRDRLGGGEIRSVSFSPDGDFFVAQYDGVADELWSVRDGRSRLLTDLGFNSQEVVWLDGKRLAVQYSDGRAYLLDPVWLDSTDRAREEGAFGVAERIALACAHPLKDGLPPEGERLVKDYLGALPRMACE